MLAVGLLVAGVALPALATAVTRRSAAEVAPLRGALAADAIDLTHGAADLAAFGATGAALRAAGGRAAGWPGWTAARRQPGSRVDAAGVLAAGATAAAVVRGRARRRRGGVLVGVLAVGAAGRGRGGAGPGRGGPAVDAAAGRPAPGSPTCSTPARGRRRGRHRGRPRRTVTPARGPALRGVTVRYRAGAAPALDGVDLDLPAGTPGRGRRPQRRRQEHAGRRADRRVRPPPAGSPSTGDLSAYAAGGAAPRGRRAARRRVRVPRHRAGEPAARPGRRGRRRAGRARPPPPGCWTGYATSPTAGTRSSARTAGSSPAGSGSGCARPGAAGRAAGAAARRADRRPGPGRRRRGARLRARRHPAPGTRCC